jgi:hypothetical protein
METTNLSVPIALPIPSLHNMGPDLVALSITQNGFGAELVDVPGEARRL